MAPFLGPAADAYPDPAGSAVEREPSRACLAAVLTELGWDVERMRWADAPGQEEP
jgi:hypothetical protein